MTEPSPSRERAEARRRARLGGDLLPRPLPKPTPLDTTPDIVVAKKAPMLPKPLVATGETPVANRTEPRTPEPAEELEGWELGALFKLMDCGLGYANFCTFVQKFMPKGRGTGTRNRYSRADAAVLQLMLDSKVPGNPSSPHRLVGAHMLTGIIDGIRAGEGERVPEVSARVGAFTVVYRPTWLP